MLLVAEVTGQQQGASSRVLDPAGGLLRVLLLLGQVREGDVGALAGVGDRDGPSDAGVTPADQRREPLQAPVAAVAALAVIGHRPHRGREARGLDRKSTRLNSSRVSISYAVFC